MNDGKGRAAKFFFGPRKISSPVMDLMETKGRPQSELEPHCRDPPSHQGRLESDQRRPRSAGWLSQGFRLGGLGGEVAQQRLGGLLGSGTVRPRAASAARSHASELATGPVTTRCHQQLPGSPTLPFRVIRGPLRRLALPVPSVSGRVPSIATSLPVSLGSPNRHRPRSQLLLQLDPSSLSTTFDPRSPPRHGGCTALPCLVGATPTAIGRRSLLLPAGGTTP